MKKVEEEEKKKIIDTLSTLRDLGLDKRATPLGDLAIFVYYVCKVFNISVSQEEKIKKLFNFLAKECSVSSNPKAAWKKVLSVEAMVQCKRLSSRDESKIRKGVEATGVGVVVEEVEQFFGKKDAKKVARKEGKRLIVEEDGFMRIPTKKKGVSQIEEERKLIVWGVSETAFHEGDIKGECIRLGMNGEKFVVNRAGRGKGRRIEIICESERSRDGSLDIIREAFKVRFGWRVVKGRYFKEREMERKGGKSEFRVEVALRNYYAILQFLEEKEKSDESQKVKSEEEDKFVKQFSGELKESKKVRKGGKGETEKKRVGRKGQVAEEGHVERIPLLRVGTWNVQGISKKWDLLAHVLQRREVDILGVCEHWMREGDMHKLGSDSRYVWFGKCSKENKEGSNRGVAGVGFLVDIRVVDMVSIVQCEESPHSSRHMWLKIRCNGNLNIFVGVVYMPVDNENVVIKKEILQEVSEQCSKLEASGEVYIVGDMNARVGVRDAKSGISIGAFGEECRNRSGNILIEWLKKERKIIFNGREKEKGIEFTRVVSKSSSILDYVIGSETSMQLGRVRKMVVAQEEEDFIGSDHRLVFVDINCQPIFSRQGKGVKVEVWKIKDAKEREREEKGSVVEAFSSALEKEMEQWSSKVEGSGYGGNVDVMFTEWKTAFEQVCSEVVGKRVKYIRKGVKKLPTLFKRLYEIRSIVRKEAEKTGSQKLFDLSKEISDKISILVFKRNKAGWEAFCKEVRANEHGPREFFILLNKALGMRKKGGTESIRNAAGEVVNNNQEVRSVWRDFFENLGRDDSIPGQFDDRFKKEVEEKVKKLEEESSSHFDSRLDSPFSPGEVSEQLKNLPNFKAAGIDGIKNELLRFCLSETGVRVVTQLLNEVWKSERLPSELNVGRIVYLFKGGDQYDCGDYRGISLLNVVYKLLSSIVNTRLTNFCEEEHVLADEQGGFRKGRGCADQAFSLYQIVAGRMREKESTYMCFIDIKKAYDRVWRDGLWVRMADCGIKGKMWRMVRAMYACTRSTVFSGGKDSDVFDIGLGVRQGDVLSPLVFSIFFNGLIEALKGKELGVVILKKKQVCGLWYADDIALLARSCDELRDMLKCVDEYCCKWRCSANAKKSGVMIIRPPGYVPDEEVGEFFLNGDKVPIVSKYKYLGIWFNDQWSWSDHVEYVLLQAQRAVSQYEFRFWKNRAVDVKTKVIAWRAMFRPAIEYGSEVWWPLEQDLIVFERLQRKVCKWILGVCVTTPIEAVSGDLGLPSLGSRFSRALLSWAGVVRCMSRDRITGLCGDINTTRVGKHTWSRRVTMALKLVRLSESFELECVPVQEEGIDEAVKRWKETVKSAVLAYELEEWRKGMQLKTKVSLYSQIKKFPEFEPYLHVEEYLRVGRLRFKFRSGMAMLNQEVGRRSKVMEDRYCVLCDEEEVEESIEHFLFICPVYKEVRKKFESRLSVCCSKYNVKSILTMWNSNDIISKSHVVLGDCTEFVIRECGKDHNPGEAARDIRLLSNKFLETIWNTRKKLIYPDPASAGGAQTPLRGSAS